MFVSCHSVKGLEPLPPSHLLCKRPVCYHSASTTHVRDMIFKLSPIHASVIVSFPEFAEFSESYAPFRKNPNVNRVFHSLYKVGRNGNIGIKGFKNTKKSYLQWDSTWCQGLLLVYESNNQTNWATEVFATWEIFKLLPMHHFIFGLWSFS